MSDQDTLVPTLFELLAREWQPGIAVESMLFNDQQTAVGFALENGSVVVADLNDSEPADQRIHVSAEDGRSIIRPRATKPKPLTVVEVANSGPILFGPLGGTDFFASNNEGGCFRISPSGDKSQINLTAEGPVSALANSMVNGQLACAAGSTVTFFNNATMVELSRVDPGDRVAALSFSSDGKSIAIAHQKGLAIWDFDGAWIKTKALVFEGRPNAIHWSPDGSWIAASLGDGGFQLVSVKDGYSRALTRFPAPVNSICWNEKANALVTSGAFRVTAWSMDTPPIADPADGALETGKAGLVPVSTVASHPKRPLIAAGYENGHLSIMQISKPAEMLLNSEDRGVITGLLWTRDGKQIACSTDQGVIALISIPPQMFK